MTNLSLSLRIGSIFIIWTASAAGVCWPFMIKNEVSTESPFFRCLKSCAAGVMLGIALMHLLPEADEVLQDVCPDYSLAFAVTAGGVILNLALEQFTMIWLSEQKKERELELNNIPSVDKFVDKNIKIDNNSGQEQTCTSPDCLLDVEGGAIIANPLSGSDNKQAQSISMDSSSDSHGHHQHHHQRRRKSVGTIVEDTVEVDSDECEGAVLSSLMESTSLKDLISLYAMELSISVHSIIIGVEIGLAAGNSQLPTLISLLVAIAFHQFVEGSGLGTILRTMKNAAGSAKVVLFVIIFALTTPAGIFIGIMTSGLPDSPSQDAAKGIAGSLACGSLLYISLAEMVATYFNASDLVDKPRLKIKMIGAFSLGVTVMAVIAIWA